MQKKMLPIANIRVIIPKTIFPLIMWYKNKRNIPTDAKAQPIVFPKTILVPIVGIVSINPTNTSIKPIILIVIISQFIVS